MLTSIKSDQLDSIYPVAKAFYEAAKMTWPPNWEHFKSCWVRLLDSGQGVILVASHEGTPVGLIAGFSYVDPFSATPCALESFWYVMPEHRGRGVRLLKAFEKWAKDRGAKEIWMACLSHVNFEAMQRIYERMGYRKRETLFTRTI